MTAYEKYQLQWMIDHGKSIEDLVREINKHRENCDPSDDLLEMFWSWEHDVGFGGEIWSCIGEWQDCEAQTDPPELADALNECDTIILVGGLDAFDNSKKLYAENKEFRFDVARKYNEYLWRYIDDCCGCVLDALSYVYKQWKNEGRVAE